jgi:hypothetical protein
MHKIVWISWLQGWHSAPPLVLKCLSSWQQLNPGWQIRACAIEDIRVLLDLPDLSGKIITSASFSDLIRAQLLHEYGGVWVDSTLLCRQPLDDWLPSLMQEGFFAYERPAPDRILASWFLAAEPGHPLMTKWCQACHLYWRLRLKSDDYFWFHHLFEKLCSSDVDFRDRWARVPKLSGNERPHRAQQLGLGNEDPDALSQLLQEQSPVLKLSHRHDPSLLGRSCLLNWLLADIPDPQMPSAWAGTSSATVNACRIASLAVKTENLGDHIQILAANALVQRLWNAPSIYIDRDNGIATLPGLPSPTSQWPIVLNGWFKTNREQWPPHPMLLPAYIGFHIRLFQCPELVEPLALAHYREHGPIGCRDSWTCELLQSHDIDAYLSHCLSLAFTRRMPGYQAPETVFVVSRDTKILDYLPPSIGPYKYINHYAGSSCFDSNLHAASQLLSLYRHQAKLIVTTLLHCALPAMAMGIPVLMVWPENSTAGRDSDRQRFSSLLNLLTVHSPEELVAVDWNPPVVDCVMEKLTAIDSFAMATRRWQLPVVPLNWSLAPAILLPPPP